MASKTHCAVKDPELKDCEAKPCGAILEISKIKLKPLNFETELDALFLKFKYSKCPEHNHWANEVCFDKKCTTSLGFHCRKCTQTHHSKCQPLEVTSFELLLEKAIPMLQAKSSFKITERLIAARQLECPKLDEISDFIDKRILRLCKLERHLFDYPSDKGFKSDYELVNDGNDILVHDKVLKSVESLLTTLNKDIELKRPTDAISAQVTKIGDECGCKDVTVVRAVKPHAIREVKPGDLMEMVNLAYFKDSLSSKGSFACRCCMCDSEVTNKEVIREFDTKLTDWIEHKLPGQKDFLIVTIDEKNQINFTQLPGTISDYNKPPEIAKQIETLAKTINELQGKFEVMQQYRQKRNKRMRLL